MNRNRNTDTADTVNDIGIQLSVAIAKPEPRSMERSDAN